MITAAGYVRVSTEEQSREGWSLGEQRRQIEAHVAEQGWELGECYEDAGFSGLTAARPSYQRLLDDAAERRYEVLVVWRTDRLGRDTVERLTAEASLARAGVRVVSLTEADIDSDGAEAPLLRAIRAGMAEMESRVIGKRAAAGLLAVARSGRPPCGPPPCGYRSVGSGRDHKWVIHEPEAELVRAVYAMYVGGLGQNSIARKLTADGRRTRRGATFGVRAVSTMLQNPVYRGFVHLNGQVYPGLHEPIVDEASWEAARTLREARQSTPGRGRGRPPVGRHVYVGGLLRCGRCGCSMSPRTKPNGSEWYRCTKRHAYGPERCDMPDISRRRVDEQTLVSFEACLFDAEGTLDSIRAEGKRRAAEALALAAQAESEATIAEERLSRVRRDYQDGRIEAEDWADQRDQLEAEQDAARAEAARHQQHAAALTDEVKALDADAELQRTVIELRETIAGRIEATESIQALRVALTATFERVELHRQEATIYLLPFVRPEAIHPSADDYPYSAPARRIPLQIGAKDGEKQMNTMGGLTRWRSREKTFST
jgi:DNA invertase Pin-like site-specific DNA recombinase